MNKLASDNEEENKQDFENFSLKNLDQSEIDELIEHLFKLDSDLGLTKPLEMIIKEDTFVNSELSTNYTGMTSIKHLKQISSIVAHVKELKIEKNESRCFIELGAGRGKLSHWLSMALKDEEINNFLLVERGSQRFKFDSYHNDNKSNRFQRIRMDIKNLYLSELDLVKQSDQLVLYGKHLCGPATDFTLHCLKRTLNDQASKFKGLLLAVCCHNYCEWDTFCGKNFFNQYNITRRQFYIIRNLTSWATCGQRATINDNEEKKLYKEKIGYMCKNLIDMARVDYLLSKNSLDDNKIKLNAKLFYYCNQNVTLENRRLIVTPK